MRSPEWSERKNRVNEPERCRGHATKGRITARNGKRKDKKRNGPRKAPNRDGGRNSGENCGKETLRRIGSLNHLGERKLGVCFPNIPLLLLSIPPRVYPWLQHHQRHVLSIACVYARTCHVRASGGRDATQPRVCARVAGPFFRSRIDRFSPFLKTLSRPSYLLFIDWLVPLFPARSACPCLHLEEVEQPASTSTLIFSSLSVRTTCAGIHGCTIS